MTRPETFLYVSEPSGSSSSRSSSPLSKKAQILSKPRRSEDHTNSTIAPSTKATDFQPSPRRSSAPWADEPYKLILKPRAKEMTGAVFCATEMSIIHNVIIRGLNSIVRQAPYIDDESKPAYNPQDVKDLLFYVQAWCRNLDHHHHVEETTFFPLVEEMTGIVGLMDDLEVEHEEFHGGVVALREYAEKMQARPAEYRWTTMKRMISGFAPALINHLHAEIDFLLHMDKFDDAGLRRCWMEAGKVAEKIEDSSVLFELFPFILGNADKTHDGGNNFPPVPKPMRFAMQHWFAKRYRRAWRFNSCDYFGRPIPLAMIPEDED